MICCCCCFCCAVILRSYELICLEFIFGRDAEEEASLELEEIDSVREFCTTGEEKLKTWWWCTQGLCRTALVRKPLPKFPPILPTCFCLTVVVPPSFPHGTPILFVHSGLLTTAATFPLGEGRQGGKRHVRRERRRNLNPGVGRMRWENQVLHRLGMNRMKGEEDLCLGWHKRSGKSPRKNWKQRPNRKGRRFLRFVKFTVNLVASETEHLTVVCKFPPGKWICNATVHTSSHAIQVKF